MTKRYWSPTPKKWRAAGDSIMIGCTGISAMITGSPLSDNTKMWTMFVLNVVGVLGKVITNFFKEGDNETDSIPAPGVTPQ